MTRDDRRRSNCNTYGKRKKNSTMLLHILRDEHTCHAMGSWDSTVSSACGSLVFLRTTGFKGSRDNVNTIFGVVVVSMLYKRRRGFKLTWIGDLRRLVAELRLV